MANKDMARVVLQLAAEQNQLRRDFDKAQKTVESSTGKMAQASARAARKMQTDMTNATSKIGASFTKMGTLAKASIAGLFAGVIGAGGAGIVMQLGDIAKGVAEIGDAAKMAGVSVKAFQEWRYVAEQARIPIDSITDGLKEMAIRADEFATTGKGSAAEAFQRLGLTPQEVKERLKDPSELLLLLIERTRKLKDVQAGVRIFDELFGGTGGERMVSLIEQGEAGIRDQIKAASDFGRVLDDDVIRKAAEIDQQFNSIAGTIGTTLKSAIVSVVGSMVDWMDMLRSLEKQRNQTIQGGINDIMAQKQEVAKALAAIDAADSKLNDRQKARARGTHEITMQQLNERENALIKELESRPSVMNFTPKSSDTWTPPAKYTPPPATGGSSARDKAAREAERERQAVTDLIADLQLEYEMIGKTEAQKAKMNALRQAGAAATAEEQLAIASKIDAIYRESDAYEKVQAAAEEAKDAARDFAGTLVDGMLNGASATETLGNALKGLASRLLNSGLDSLFSGGGLFSLFGGGGGLGKNYFPPAPLPMYAAGTSSAQRGIALVGEKGPELVRFKGGEQVVPNHQLAAAMSAPSLPNIQALGGGGGASVKLAPVYNIDARGADAAAVARLQAGFEKAQRNLKGEIINTVRQAQKGNVKLN
ncbi:phage tail tape measure protein [Agrobacterium pusense]|uniref:Phage tail tape measure protein n=1 Tax=Agrobacterium pusense TaxID=648995 RepID=A0A6H0ZJ95_9HYPH|nr:phage tail tape measure protein [Agrobacterium pusense]QIX20223.1 phage tail tape measure protein [Agrobacterium pusense]